MEVNEFFRDEKKVQEGTWVGELTGFDADFQLKVRGLTSKDYTAKIMRIQRTAPNKAREVDRSLKLEYMRELLADLFPDYIVLDWKGVNKDGKPLPYDKELLRKLLKEPGSQRLSDAITEAASRVDAMQRETQEATAKN